MFITSKGVAVLPYPPSYVMDGTTARRRDRWVGHGQDMGTPDAPPAVRAYIAMSDTVIVHELDVREM
ncbi:hypothetical protein ABZY44_01020 [Streptomyces sp. NPDC006544]|uniref:hypothetical protein n=1 Tax=Streptomyces sp. NPDC006544 TaxID=3154583 RepID=UPI00339E22F5